MTAAFYISAVVAVISTVLVITGTNAVHALLCLILSLLSIAVIFFLLGAPFAAALEVIIYAGAIMVMFVFVVMMLNVGRGASKEETGNMKFSIWAAPLVLAIILSGEIFYVLVTGGSASLRHGSGQALWSAIEPKEVGIALFGPYLAGVEIASLLLLAGLLGAYHLGVHEKLEGHARRGRDSI